jgi:predicted DNA-binding protein
MRHERKICDDQISLRLPSAVRDQIEQAASQEGRKPANLIRLVIERWLAQRQQGGESAAA